MITAVYTSIKKCVEEGSELETVTPRVFSDLSVYGYDSRLELLIKRAIEFYRIYKSLKANLVICKVDQKFDPGRNEWKGDTTSTMVSLIPGLEVDGIVLIKEIVTTRSYSDFKIW